MHFPKFFGRPLITMGRLLPLMFILLASCAAPPGPAETATQFWRALMAGNSDALRQLVRDEDRELLDGGRSVLPVHAFTLGHMVVEGSRAEIATRLSVAGDTPVNLEVTTVLAQIGNQGRADYARTTRDLSHDSELAKMIEHLRQLAARAGTGLNRSLDELKDALPALESELSNIEKDIRAQVPELRKRLEELGRQLRQGPVKSAPPPDYRKAI